MSFGEKVDGLVAKVKAVDVKSALKKSVTVPVKVILVAGVAVIVLAVALSLSRKVEPQLNTLFWDTPPSAALDLATAEMAVRGLKEHITATCKPVKPDAKKGK